MKWLNMVDASSNNLRCFNFNFAMLSPIASGVPVSVVFRINVARCSLTLSCSINDLALFLAEVWSGGGWL
jgi:hypothetical protein